MILNIDAISCDLFSKLTQPLYLVASYHSDNFFFFLNPDKQRTAEIACLDTFYFRYFSLQGLWSSHSSVERHAGLLCQWRLCCYLWNVGIDRYSRCIKKVHTCQRMGSKFKENLRDWYLSEDYIQWWGTHWDTSFEVKGHFLHCASPTPKVIMQVFNPKFLNWIKQIKLKRKGR